MREKQDYEKSSELFVVEVTLVHEDVDSHHQTIGPFESEELANHAIDILERGKGFELLGIKGLEGLCLNFAVSKLIVPAPLDI